MLSSLPLLKLLQITSPSLPVGAYSYSQGLEWATESKWVTDKSSFKQWLLEQLQGLMAEQELPLLQRLYDSFECADLQQQKYWTDRVIAMRETSELRREEQHRGRALASLLDTLFDEKKHSSNPCQLTEFARYCSRESITLEQTLLGYAYSWLDNQVTAGIKLIPLGQSDGQSLLHHFSVNLEQAVQIALSISDDEIGYSSPALAMASSLHETQYCRLYRS